MAVGSVQAVGYGMTKPQRWLVIDSAKFARWLVRHLWGNLSTADSIRHVTSKEDETRLYALLRCVREVSAYCGFPSVVVTMTAHRVLSDCCAAAT